MKNFLYKAFLVISLAFYAWILFDLFTHPVAVGPNAGGNLFRWLSALAGTINVVVALFIMRRVKGNPVGPLLLAWGVGAAGWSIRREWTDPGWGVVALLVFIVYFFCIACPAAILICFYFPTGKTYPPRLDRWAPVIVGLMAISGIFALLGSSSGGIGNLTNPLFVPALAGVGEPIYLIGLIVGMCVGLVSLVMRYRAGDERQRLQLRWIVWLLGMCILLAVFPFERLFGPRVASLVLIVSYLIWQIFPALGIGIPLLRHNLWGIDILIRKTLVYGLLTGFLALLYFGLVTLLQSLSASVLGRQSPVITVLSTLAIAALFNPLRIRIQDVIDRRFYRKKYDAEKALAKFAEAARNETDIECLNQALIETLQETMQPEHVQLWLKPPEMKPSGLWIQRK